MDFSKVFDVFRSNPTQERSIVEFRRSFIGVASLLASLMLIALITLVGAANYSQQISLVNTGMDQILVEEVEAMGYSIPGHPSEEDEPSDTADTNEGDNGWFSSSFFGEQIGKISIFPDGSGGIRLEDSLLMYRNTSEDQIIATVTYSKTPEGDINVNTSAIQLDYQALDDALAIAFADAEKKPSQIVYGSIGVLGLRYSAFVGEDGERAAVFVSGYFIQQSMMSLLVAFGIPALVAMAAFFLLSVFLSYTSSRPLEEAWKYQKRFIADASHELKTPLAVIKASNSLVAQDPEATVESRQRWVDTIDSESNRMLEMVNDMLFLARSGVASNDKVSEEIDFSSLVMGMVLHFESLAFEMETELTESIDSGVYVKGDPDRLRRLVGTLADNAIKYAGAGGHVDVTLLKQTTICILKVSNDGPVIPDEDLPHIFERFYRADKARSRQTGGFGLGLAIAQEVTQEMGGLITAVSTVEDGTSFIVRLPISVK